MRKGFESKIDLFSCLSLVLLSFLITFCSRDKSKNVEDKQFSIIEMSPPSHSGGEPNLFVDASQKVYLTWIESDEGNLDALYFSNFEGNHWTSPKLISKGNNWFVNWADFPSMVSFDSNPSFLAAHWLQMRDTGTYDYDIHISISKDGGTQWSPSFLLHSDGVSAEHGFVSMVPLANGRILAVWLDGRNTKNATSKEDHHHEGTMTLRSAEFDIDGNLFNEVELDDKVCDCCQTDVVGTPYGPIVVYRDRSDVEIRDISVIRKEGKEWGSPINLFPDLWEIAGCPVNGPAIDAVGEDVAVSWFTSGGDTSKVQIIFSTDGGASFGDPILVSDRNPSGRVDICLMDDKKALVSWIENINGEGEIWVAIISPEGKHTLRQKITPISSARRSGFPILNKAGDKYFLVWTVFDSISHIKTLTLSM